VLRPLLRVAGCWLWLGCAAESSREPNRPGEPSEPPGDAPAAVEYRRDVEPILSAQCTGCHRADGNAPFALDGYARAAPHARAIALATRARRMPPWPPQADDRCPPLVGARGLTENEIALLEAWAETGAPEGERGQRDPDQPVRAQPLDELTHVSAVLRAGEPYLPRPRVDDHRCFAVDPQLAADRYLTAYAVRQDVPGIVHHVQLWAIDDPAVESELDALDAADPGPGYACPQGHALPARYVSVWAPSEPVRRHPNGTGVLLPAGRRMVIQIHYHDRLGLELPDRTAIELELADHVARPASLWTVSNGEILLPPGQARSTVRALSPIPADAPVQLWGVRPHMHALGSSAQLTARDGVDARCLLSVPRWDPAWQLMYFYPQPIELSASALLEVECNYDTRTQTAPVRYGIGTADEMCFGFFYVTE
jgi:hypothetical protein